MFYNFGEQGDIYPKITMANEDDRKILDSYRRCELIDFEFVLETIKEHCGIEEMTTSETEQLFEAIYSGLDPLIQDAVSEVFE